MVKKVKKVQEKAQKEKLKTQKHPLSQPAPKNFRHGNDIRPRIVKSRFVKFPRYPNENEYPTEDGLYITMMDCNEHEVCVNKFHDGHFSWMDKTHVKWWMKLPE